MHSHTRRTAALLALALLPLAARAAAAQADLPALNSLRPTTAPAFVVLGVAPADVSRPSTPADLGLSLANASQRFTTVPQNYALETSPFWLKAHPELTWQSDSTRSLAQSIARTLAVSAASAELGGPDSSRAGLAFGFRANLLSGHISRAVRDSLAALAQALSSEGAVFEKYAAPQRAQDDAAAQAELARIASLTDPAQRQAAMQAFRTANEARKASLVRLVESNPAYQAEISGLRKRFQNFALRREGAMLEVAAGAAWGFPDRVWQAGRLDRVGAWLTYGCERCLVASGTVPITPLLMVRYYHGGAADGSVPDRDVVDAGGRLIVTGPRYDLAAEGVVRSFMGSDAPKSVYRVTGNFDYQVGPGLWLLATFGRDYQSRQAGSMVAELGLKLNFAQYRYAGPGS